MNERGAALPGPDRGSRVRRSGESGLRRLLPHGAALHEFLVAARHRPTGQGAEEPGEVPRVWYAEASGVSRFGINLLPLISGASDGAGERGLLERGDQRGGHYLFLDAADAGD